MFYSGITSATTRDLSPEDTIRIATQAGLQGIEWEAMKHVVPGEIERAREIAMLCRQNGLAIPSYGSYYRAGVSEAAGMPFSQVLRSAKALDTKLIRIWAGTKDYEEATNTEKKAVIEDSLRVAEIAKDAGVGISFEFHVGTLTNTTESALWLAERTQHSHIHFSWQPLQATPQSVCEHSLQSLLPRLSTLHVFHWDMGEYAGRGYTRDQFLAEDLPWHRYPLAEGREAWSRYFDIAAITGRDHWAFLEFVKADRPEQIDEDAQTLKSLLQQVR